MTDVSTYSLAILAGVVIFAVVLSVLRLLQVHRMKSAAGAIDSLQGSKDLHEAETPIFHPSLYGIPYLAWILTSIVVLAAFLVIFFENMVRPYPVPELGSQHFYAYRAPASFQIHGRFFDRHELLVRKGKTISARDRSLIQEALNNHRRANTLRVSGSLALLAVFSLILLYHINILYPTTTEKNRNLILIYVMILVVVLCAKICLFYDLFSPFLIPVPWAGMVITILIHRRIVPLITLTTLILISVSYQLDSSLFLVLLSGGLLSGSWVRQAHKRNQVMLSALWVGFVMALVYAGHSMLTSGYLELDSNMLAAVSNGIISGLLTLIFLPLLELAFDFASPFRLMELLDLNTPLLKEFFFKAPGTYQHTMVVANIAEAVANELGANALLVRVGSYYHDIGKMFNPEYFIENQASDQNPHDQLGPVASAALVRSHVILGVGLAKKIGLPSAVVDFIPEHHGTATIDYFYYKSKQLESEIKSERIFKYPGPRPQSPETAILMLVDSVEAAFRVLQERDEEAIRGLVKKIVDRKLEQGQLSQSGLTIGELERMIEILTHILKSTSHDRIQYPSSQALKGPSEEIEPNLQLLSKRD